MAIVNLIKVMTGKTLKVVPVKKEWEGRAIYSKGIKLNKWNYNIFNVDPRSDTLNVSETKTDKGTRTFVLTNIIKINFTE